MAERSASKSVELARAYWNTFGVALYRAGEMKAAIQSLNRSHDLGSRMIAFNGFFLAMAHQRLSEESEARKWYTQAVTWIEEHDPKNKELQQLRQEAQELIE